VADAAARNLPRVPADAADAARPDRAPARLIAPLLPLVARPLALAVSGGPDSTALLHLAAAAYAAAEAAAESTGPAVPPPLVLTVDHGLRPEAAAEARAVAAAAAALGLPAEILVWRHDASSPHPAGNLQAAARAARYALLADAARRHGRDTLLVAHTRDDQAETVLIALARGSGVYGLAAMPARRTLAAGVTLVRPFLDTAKADLVAYLDAAGIAYARDPSNADPRFARARLRRAVPVLTDLGLTPDRLAATARAMARAAAALDAAVDRLVAEVLTGLGGALGLDAGRLAGADDEIRLRALARLLVAVGGADHPPRLERLERLDAALRAAVAGRRPAAATLAGVRVALAASGRLWLIPEAGRAGFPDRPLVAGETVAWDHRTRVDVPSGLTADARLTALGAAAADLRRRGLVAVPTAPAAALAALPAIVAAGAVVAVPDLALVLDPAYGGIRLERAPPAALFAGADAAPI
jgi:tRNA(Ile)-lysidine synthase